MKKKLKYLVPVFVVIGVLYGWHLYIINPSMPGYKPEYFDVRNFNDEESLKNAVDILLPVGTPQAQVDHLMKDIAKLDYSDPPVEGQEPDTYYMFYHCSEHYCRYPSSFQFVFDVDNRKVITSKVSVIRASLFGMNSTLIMFSNIVRNPRRE